MVVEQIAVGDHGVLEEKWDLRVPVVQLDSGNCRCRKWTAATKS